MKKKSILWVIVVLLIILSLAIGSIGSSVSLDYFKDSMNLGTSLGVSST